VLGWREGNSVRIVYWSPVVTIIADILIWAVFHLSIGYWCAHIPVERFDYNHWSYQTFKWEQGGEIYQKLFKVKNWKRFIPSGAALYQGAYQIKHVAEFTVEGVKLWLKESCRSEFCHRMMILPGFLFFLWNEAVVGWIMVAYAVLNNLIPIIMQRYNRPRIRKLLARLEEIEREKSMELRIYEPQKAFSHSYE
jgi:glycosyl-4,4'-diaponeurosporenoate acyltransferase